MNSSELRGYLTGLIFGDGRIDGGNTKRAFTISSIYKDFIDEIQSNLESCTNFKISIKHIPEHNSGGCRHKDAWILRVQAHPYFAKKYHHFYDDFRHRVASKESLEWLTPHGLANWYMSDGYICLVGKTKGRIWNRRIDICTDRYSKATIESMCAALKRSFNLDSSIIKRGEFYRIRIRQASYNDFIRLVSPYIVPSMRHKLYLGYEEKPYWMGDDVWEIQKEIIKCGYPTDNGVGIRDSLESSGDSTRLKNPSRQAAVASSGPST
jgi:hypothetical protein